MPAQWTDWKWPSDLAGTGLGCTEYPNSNHLSEDAWTRTDADFNYATNWFVKMLRLSIGTTTKTIASNLPTIALSENTYTWGDEATLFDFTPTASQVNTKLQVLYNVEGGGPGPYLMFYPKYAYTIPSGSTISGIQIKFSGYRQIISNTGYLWTRNFCTRVYYEEPVAANAAGWLGVTF